jgi:3-carboxy-cis,cis-muconate cycloisomerase
VYKTAREKRQCRTKQEIGASRQAGQDRHDLMLMSATEFGEAAEPFVQGRGSELDDAPEAQPDLVRDDPRGCESAVPQAGLVLDAVETDFERATGPWHVEWVALPEALGFARRRPPSGAFHVGG